MATLTPRPSPKVAHRFGGFSPEALQFLGDLAAHNERAWFAPRKAFYEAELLGPLHELLAAATAALKRAKIPLGSDPRKRTFRIYRDVRFSPDKSPYKTNLGAFLPHDGNHESLGGLYVHVQPQASFLAAGFYGLERPELQRWREAIAAAPKKFQTALRALERNGSRLSESHDALKRMPRGFEAHAQSELAPYFRTATFMVSESLSDAEVCSPRLVERIVDLAKRARPLLNYGWETL